MGRPKFSAHVRVDKNEVIKLTCFFYGSVRAYCQREKISSARYYEILNVTHASTEVECLKTLAKNLKTTVGEIIE